MLGINDSELNRIAFLSKSSGERLDRSDANRNGRASYLGDGIITALVSDLLYVEFDVGESALKAMRQALLDPTVLSNISQRTSLSSYIATPLPEHPPDNNTLSLAFKSYIGCLYHDRGPAGYTELRDWFYSLVRPYAMTCKSNYDKYTELKRSPNRDPRYTSFSSSSGPYVGGHAGPASDSYYGYPLEDPTRIARPGTAAPDLRMYGSSNAVGRHGSHAVKDYIQQLKEFCEKHRLPPPVYSDADNGSNGDRIRWCSTVAVGGDEGTSTDWALTKKEARAMASKVLLNKFNAYRSGA
ncbi:hypothetical protein DRE_02607 [Drechslerella stenobrocha 248]|uniref:RNase III domain-containing protein n=1 Tax=Drechslerella stenobrocha 248 TaxID=1043628 RepID=W7I6X9_9PEZI|nr:hypothetical protein DRE_02607 [Drechslerella stenobrocha 248]